MGIGSTLARSRNLGECLMRGACPLFRRLTGSDTRRSCVKLYKTRDDPTPRANIAPSRDSDVMPDEFDPYQQWLGIAKHEQPPNHYRLLGVGTLMEDRDAIGNAADRQMNFVRTFQLGQHRELSQKILRELAEAKICLLNPASKIAYDAALRGQPSAPPAAVAAPPAPARPPAPVSTPPVTPPAPSPTIVAPPTQPEVSLSPAPLEMAPARTRRPAKRGGMPQWAWIGLGVVMTLCVLVWMISRVAESRRAAHREKKQRSKPSVEAPSEPAGPSVTQNPDDGIVACIAALAALDGEHAKIVTRDNDTFLTDLEMPGDGAHWTFVLKKGQRGIFSVVIDYACPKEAEGGKFSVSVNGKAVKGTHAVRSTSGATTFERAEIGFVKIQQLDQNTLRLAVETRAPAGTTIMNIRAIRLKLVQKGVSDN